MKKIIQKTIPLFILSLATLAYGYKTFLTNDTSNTIQKNAQDNGLQKLSSGQTVLFRGKPKSVNPNGKTTTFSIGTTGQTIKLTEGEAVVSVQGDGIANILAPIGQPGVETYGPTNLRTVASRKVQPSVIDQIQKNGTAHVIIRTKIGSRYFGTGRQNNSERFARSQEFQDVKRSIEAILSHRGKITRDLQVINGFAASIDMDSLKSLQSHSKISEIRIDVEMHTLLDTSTQQIKATSAWSMTNADAVALKGNGMTIAVIDTGVDYTHPDLGGCFGTGCKVVGGYDFHNNDSDPMDDHGHGTHCAATAAGNGIYPGVAPEAKILAYKVASQYGTALSSFIIQGIQAAMDPNGDSDTSDHADVISMSLGGPGNPEDDISEAVNNATAVGVVSAIAAGNSGPTEGSIMSPGMAATAVTVAAACKPDQIGEDYRCDENIASFSSRGPLIWEGIDLQKPDVAAPGVLICAARWGTAFTGAPTCLDEHHSRISGTSMATPHVAGAIALLKQSQPWLTPEEIKQTLKSSASTLGMTANAQGAGLINVESAILQSGDFEPSVIAQPSYWTIVSNPSSQTSFHSMDFNITGFAISPSTLTMELNSPINGVSFTTSPLSIDVSSGSSVALTANLTIDQDVAISGVYSREILFKDIAGFLRGTVHVNVTVSPTVIITAGLIDYGIDNPSLSTWISPVQTIQISNLRTDASQIVSVSMSGFPAGVSFDPSGSISVGPGETQNLDTTLTVSNGVVSNGIYSGTLTVDNGLGSTMSTSAKFIKYYVLQVVDSLETPFSLSVHNRLNTSYFMYPTPGQTTFYLNEPGNYDLIATYYNPETWKLSYVVKENFAVSDVGTNSVYISNTDAIHKLENTMTASNTESVTPYMVFGRIVFNGTSLGLQSISGSLVDSPATQYFSTISNNYFVERAYDPYMFFNNANIFYDSVSTGINADISFSNEAADLKGPTVSTRFNMSEGQSNEIYLYSQSPTIFGTSAYFPPTGSDTIKVQSTYPDSWNATNQGIYGAVSLRSNFTRADCPATGPCETIFETPFYFPTNSTGQKFFFDTSTLSPRSTDQMSIGMGPTVWFGQFQNETTQIVLSDIHNMGILLKRQDYAIGEYEDISYDVLNSTNAVIGSGVIPGYSHGIADGDTVVGFPILLEPSTFPLPSQGKYSVAANIPYTIQNTPYLATMSATFKTNIDDKNPPSIRKLYIYNKDYQRVEFCKKNKKTTVEFEIDPNGGILDLTKTTLKYTYDTGATGLRNLDSWTSEHGTTFSGTLPKDATASKVTILIKTKDDSKNLLTYQFELPVQ